MKINVFSCVNDPLLNDHSLLNHSNIHSRDLRSIHDTPYFNPSIVLLSEHSTNYRVIRYIRNLNVLTPIYIISNRSIYYFEINGTIKINQINYDHISNLINDFPQKHIWDYVFKIDEIDRKELILQRYSLV